MDNKEIKLSRYDRYMLSNQLRILEALYPDEAKDFAVRREAIEQGYEMFYNWHLEHIYDGDDIMSSNESLEVWDTLEMFGEIDRAFANDDDIGDETFRKFFGYDGNNESKFLAFAEYTVERLQRFTYVPLKNPGSWNSHMPARDIYKRMLKIYKELPENKQFNLSSDDVRAILSAARHKS